MRKTRHISVRRLTMPIVTLASFLLLLTATPSTAYAQDIHFSQIDVNPILFNPAYSGFFDGNGRFGLVYRNQWASVSKAFQTIAATAEYSVMRRRYFRDGLNIGAILYSDRAGTLRYGTSSANIIVSYYKALSTRNNNFLSLAIEAGLGQAGFSTDDIDLRDPSEAIELSSTGFFTLGAGAAWFFQPQDHFYLKAAISARNINQPDISYLNLPDAVIHRRINALLRAEYKILPDISILPIAAAMLQHNYREFLVGCDAKFYLSQSSLSDIALSAGILYRWRDAAIVQLSAEYNAFVFALSYDANLSKLTPATNTLGSVEVALLYRLVHNKKISHKSIPCPII